MMVLFLRLWRDRAKLVFDPGLVSRPAKCLLNGRRKALIGRYLLKSMKDDFYPHHSFGIKPRLNREIRKASISGGFLVETWAGIAPARKSFADSCLTTWLPGQKGDGWARLGLNQGPPTYQISALPLSYAPLGDNFNIYGKLWLWLVKKDLKLGLVFWF